MKCKMPEKPEKQKDQIAQLWDAVYNHIPTQLRWQNIKINFILVFVGLILAALVVGIPVIIVTILKIGS